MTERNLDAPVTVLAKIGRARVGADWHYHLANQAGRPRCGTLLNLRDWQTRELPHAPGNMCARCARLLRPARVGTQKRVRIALSAAPAADDAAREDQLPLPLADL